MTPPFGVIGPSSLHSQDLILTHDFVHRTHMDIFEGRYYPLEFSDWFMDDWISAVYGPLRTVLSRKVGVDHHSRLGLRGSSYEATRSNENLLAPLIKSGQQNISRWMVRHNIAKHVVTAYEEDVAAMQMLDGGNTISGQNKKDNTVKKFQEIY